MGVLAPPAGLGAPAAGAPAALLPPAVLSQQQAMQMAHMHNLQRQFASGQMTAQTMASLPPPFRAYLHNFSAAAATAQQQAAQQAHNFPAAAAPAPKPVAAAKGEQQGGKKAAAAAAAAAANVLVAPAPPPPARKRKPEFRLPDKMYNILPESPLFVAGQDTERRVDAATTRKRAELQETYTAFVRGERRR
jgi:hypothetical protein